MKTAVVNPRERRQKLWAEPGHSQRRAGAMYSGDLIGLIQKQLRETLSILKSFRGNTRACLLVEPMWGNGAGWFPKLLGGGNNTIWEIHAGRNPRCNERKSGIDRLRYTEAVEYIV